MAGAFPGYYEHEKVTVSFNIVNLFICIKNLMFMFNLNVIVFTNHYS